MIKAKNLKEISNTDVLRNMGWTVVKQHLVLDTFIYYIEMPKYSCN